MDYIVQVVPALIFGETIGSSSIYRIEFNCQHFYEKTFCLTESSAAGEKNMDFYANITGFPSQNSTELHEN